ncbi:MAG: hypothetical protein QOG62_2337 [Thermoleophilaceae bacterium]|nr:hypothetical protein [Thermoleophilaceae bacterium]
MVGAGDLGAPAAAYLVAAGVGRVGIVDEDRADQVAAGLGALNADVLVEPYPVPLEGASAESIVAGAGVVLDCSGSVASGYALNEACCLGGIPLVEVLLAGLEGSLISIRPGQSACLRCAFPEDPAGAGDGPVAAIPGPVGGLFGTIQALEAVKLLSGSGEPLLNRVLRLDAGSLAHSTIEVRRRADCSVCAGLGPSAQLG